MMAIVKFVFGFAIGHPWAAAILIAWISASSWNWWDNRQEKLEAQRATTHYANLYVNAMQHNNEVDKLLIGAEIGKRKNADRTRVTIQDIYEIGGGWGSQPIPDPYVDSLLSYLVPPAKEDTTKSTASRAVARLRAAIKTARESD